MPPKTLEAQHSLSSNIQGLRFMQSARENEERKKMENEKLRHLEDMQWVIPGFEAEVEAETRQEKRAPEAQATASTVLLHRRSYKGFNGMVEQAMKDLLKKHAQAKAQDEEVEQAKTLRKMKQQRTKAEVLNAHGAYATNGLPVNNLHPPHALQDNLTDFLHQGVMELFEYVPNSLEVFVGQMLELWPPVSQMRGCLFAVAPRLPAGVMLDERSGLLHGRPQERTPGQVTYFITACNPQRSPTMVNVALVKLTVNHAFDQMLLC